MYTHIDKFPSIYCPQHLRQKNLRLCVQSGLINDVNGALVSGLRMCVRIYENIEKVSNKLCGYYEVQTVQYQSAVIYENTFLVFVPHRSPTSSRKMSFYSRPMAAERRRRRKRSDEWFAFVRRARWEKKTFQTDDDSRTAGRWEAWILKGLINLWKPWNWTFAGFARSISGKTSSERAKLQANPTENILFSSRPSPHGPQRNIKLCLHAFDPMIM